MACQRNSFPSHHPPSEDNFFFFLNQTFRDVSSFARRCNLRFGLPECNYLSWTSRAGLGMERQEDFPLSTGRPLVGKSAHLHLSWHYFKRGIPPELEFRGVRREAGGHGHPEVGRTGGARQPPLSHIPWTRSHPLCPRPPASLLPTSTPAQRKTWDFRYKRCCFPLRQAPKPASTWKLAEVPEWQSIMGPAGPTAAHRRGRK